MYIIFVQNVHASVSIFLLSKYSLFVGKLITHFICTFGLYLNIFSKFHNDEIYTYLLNTRNVFHAKCPELIYLSTIIRCLTYELFKNVLPEIITSYLISLLHTVHSLLLSKSYRLYTNYCARYCRLYKSIMYIFFELSFLFFHFIFFKVIKVYALVLSTHDLIIYFILYFINRIADCKLSYSNSAFIKNYL
jgi:hypothetical protein